MISTCRPGLGSGLPSAFTSGALATSAIQRPSSLSAVWAMRNLRSSSSGLNSSRLITSMPAVARRTRSTRVSSCTISDWSSGA